jgi:YgiT-type zinc finger domain-containing protein
VYKHILCQTREKIRTLQVVMTIHAEEEMSDVEPTLICDICGKEGAKLRHVSRSYGKGDSLLVIENVPVISCPRCGESYLTAETLHEIERIKQHRQSTAVPRQVPVAQFV